MRQTVKTAFTMLFYVFFNLSSVMREKRTFKLFLLLLTEDSGKLTGCKK